MKRRLKVYPTGRYNALHDLYRYIRFVKLFKNTLIIEITRYVPHVGAKRWMYRHLLKMTVGEKTAFAFKAMPDILYPEKIKIGRNVIIGYNTILLTHEFLTESLRVGEVEIGDHTMIGANVTVLPGVKIGSHVQVGAGSVVSKDIPDHTLAYGNPIQLHSKR
ncbi:acyltransferase [Staphylococcus intermedius]|uniref:Acetyltransferase n=1 Tax=Staphylococcus intermedius NCTC 11048 TaxID=1141106 RepID=A0A380GAD4_STAIN|nr:acyltransferase [Staphylococcus intermedius]PCF65437.1 acetyltransferase [Staphylococcus intermedius]PCF82397.1 acetyltransferase [Staphylococcus intermedius]PCF87098.1 acetyltransferase [Staphylococcus intermedius]PCF87656.1 acetyltransferase [Staphylococcus intermedius]PNZ54233.1 acyltransferase [Staphylococcus intermedius NCTC 11048]